MISHPKPRAGSCWDVLHVASGQARHTLSPLRDWHFQLGKQVKSVLCRCAALLPSVETDQAAAGHSDEQPANHDPVLRYLTSVPRL
jgi:hypothetical protein